MVSFKPTLPQSDEEQDRLYNPGEQLNQEKLNAGFGGHDNLAGYNRQTDGLDDHPISAGDASGTEPDYSQAVRQAENDPDTNLSGGFYKPSESGQKKKKFVAKALLKRKGPLAAIIATLLGGGGIVSLLFAPGLGIVQMKEIMVGDLNDQLSALDIRSDHVFRAKLKSLQAGGGVCSNVVRIKCRFTTMNEKQVQKFRDAGFDIETEATVPFGRQRITSMKLTLPDNSTVNISDPQDLINARKTTEVRAALSKVYNPLSEGFSDSTASRIFSLKKISKAKTLSATTEEGLDEQFDKATAGTAVSGSSGVKTDENGKQYIEDGENGKVYAGDPRFDALKATNDSISAKAVDIKTSGVKAVSSTLDSGLKGISLVGAADSACTVYNASRAVAAAAKVTRSLQLIQFAMVFLNTADSIKAGDATPEQVEYIGKKLTATDTKKTVNDELSESNGSTIQSIGQNSQGHDNPFYGKNAFDSPGYALAAYNDAPTLTTRSQQYMIGGGLAGTLSGVTNSIASILGANGPAAIRSTCGTVQSWWARGAGLLAGVAAGIGSFGTSTVVSIAASVAIGFALPFLESALADIVAGKVVDNSTQGVDAGDAIFAGSSAMFGSLAQARGLKPLNKSELQSYLAVNNQVQSDIAESETYLAKSTPFDIMNQYSFAGKVARSVDIGFLQNSSVFGTITGALQIVPKGLSLLSPATNAAQTFNDKRFSMCPDEGYAELGIDADDFCNVRYGLSNAELNMDSEQVVDYMVSGGYIDPDTGNATNAPNQAYAHFLQYCVNRENGWGETSNDDQISDNDLGLSCMKDTFEGANTSDFRVYTTDKTINDGMDDEDTSDTTPSEVNSDTTTIDQAHIYEDSTNIACATGTNDAGVQQGYKDGKEIDVRLCSIPNTIDTSPGKNRQPLRINSRISGATLQMVKALTASSANKGKTTLTVADSFRSMDDQRAAYKLYGGGRAAKPGYSNHQMGLAIDFQLGSNNGVTRPGDPVYDWLVGNAKQYGFAKLSSEAWHWQPIAAAGSVSF